MLIATASANRIEKNQISQIIIKLWKITKNVICLIKHLKLIITSWATRNCSCPPLCLPTAHQRILVNNYFCHLKSALFWATLYKIFKRDILSLSKLIHWTLLNEITLGQTITDPFNWMILITEWASTYVRYDRVTRAVFFNLFEVAEPKLPSKKLCGTPTFLS